MVVPFSLMLAAFMPISVSASSVLRPPVQSGTAAFVQIDRHHSCHRISKRSRTRRNIQLDPSPHRAAVQSTRKRLHTSARQTLPPSSSPSALHLHSSLASSFQNVSDWTPLYLSSIAGASTCIGAAIVFLFPQDVDTGMRKISPQILSFALALAGSVMITVSAISIGPECLDDVRTAEELLHRIISFLVGGGLYYLISHYILPEPEDVLVQNIGYKSGRDDIGASIADDDGVDNLKQINPTNDHEREEEKMLSGQQQQRAWRLAILLFLSLLFHNFPEGLAVSASAIENDKLGFAVAAGIAMHNIPEGVCISVPCLAARPDQPWLAFALASISGLAEPVAALVPLLLLSGDSSIVGMGNVLAFAAGIMVTVALWELLPEARRQLTMAAHINNELFPKQGNGESYYLGGLFSGFVLMYGTESYLDLVL